MASQKQNQSKAEDLLEELSDADLATVVGGTASGLLTGAGNEVGDLGEVVGEEAFGENGVLDLYDFLFGG